MGILELWTRPGGTLLGARSEVFYTPYSKAVLSWLSMPLLRIKTKIPCALFFQQGLIS